MLETSCFWGCLHVTGRCWRHVGCLHFSVMWWNANTMEAVLRTSTLAFFPPLCWLASIFFFSSFSLFSPHSPSSYNHPHRPIVPMEYMGEEYFKTKATVVKYERFLLKVRRLPSWGPLLVHCESASACSFPSAVIIGTRLLCARETPSQG